MSTSVPADEVPPRGTYNRVGRVLAIVLALIIFLGSLTELRKVDAAGVSAASVYASIAFAVIVVLIQAPAFYKRLPRIGRRFVNLAIVASLLVWVSVGMSNDAAWEASPGGKEEAADRARYARERQIEEAAEARDAAEREKTARSLAELEANQKRLEDLNDKLEACFSSGHRLSALEDEVKGRLHNPAAFEHVETILTVPDAESNNVVMRFRAENGFGAIRTGHVKAQLVADDCSIQNITEMEVD